MCAPIRSCGTARERSEPTVSGDLHGFAGPRPIRIARESRPALILMDLQLPGMDGIAALAALRADPRTKGIPVIAVTASAMTHHRLQILAAGFDGYQTKPVGVREFLDLVRHLLDHPRAKDEPK